MTALTDGRYVRVGISLPLSIPAESLRKLVACVKLIALVDGAPVVGQMLRYCAFEFESEHVTYWLHVGCEVRAGAQLTARMECLETFVLDPARDVTVNATLEFEGQLCVQVGVA